MKILRLPLWLLAAITLFGSGCAQAKKGPLVIYLEGAGWYGSAGDVEQGLRKAGYKGDFDTFSWSAFLGPVHDHIVNAKSRPIARRLARRIEKQREADPTSQLDLMGLSAGTAVVLLALEEMKPRITVDNVVLFSPSVGALHDLTPAMQHVRRNLYATCSPHDAIMKGLVVNSDGVSGPPAGTNGFRVPVKPSRQTALAYQRVVNLPWQPSYIGFEWDGSHTGVTSSPFVAAAIGPRILTRDWYPLDRSLADRGGMSATELPE